jgi:type IV secretion system protein TrbL
MKDGASEGSSTKVSKPSTTDAAPSRPPEKIAAETEAARRDFHRAAAAGSRGQGASHAVGRSGALQAFFAANAGRSLLPSGESSGVLSPSLKTEES